MINKFKGFIDFIISVGKLVSIGIGVGTFIMTVYGKHIESIINTKNSKMVERIIYLEEFDRQRYIYLIHKTYSLLKSNHTVPTSELEFITRFRSKFYLEDKVIEKKLEFIYERYLERTN